MSNNSSNTQIPENGYDLPIYGLHDGSFNTIHIVAISCLSISVLCAVITCIVSFKVNGAKAFFTSWLKRDRFVIYMAICDGLYGICHLADHVNVYIVQDHVYPKSLCVFYSFVVNGMFIAQNLLVNLIAINAFALMYFGYNVNFGKFDWKLLLWVFGVPLMCGLVTTAADKFGPTGAYCSFDAITGATFQFVFVSILIMIILPTNVILYVIICVKLYKQMRVIKQTVGPVSAGLRASFKVVKSMALFVTAYVIQWWVAALIGFWGATNTYLPQVMIQLAVSFSNVGGFLNLIVFVLIHRRLGVIQPFVTSATSDVTRPTNR